MPLKLYKMDLSPPACAAMMICEVHNVPVEMIELNLLEGDHLKPDYLKMNPMHTLPVLEDDDLFIHDSHTILTYLTDKYGKDDSLYPKDLKKRALVDQKLFFEAFIFTRMKNITYNALFEGVRQPSEKSLNELREALDFLEKFLDNSKFVALEQMTIADISLAATIATIRNIIPIEEKYPKTQAWFTYMEKQPFYQKRTAKGSAVLKDLLAKHLDL